MGMLSSKMRDVLIDHLDGRPVPLLRTSELSGVEAKRCADRWLTTRSLLLRGFLKHNSNGAKAPTHTLVTEAGRRELGALLGEYADAIVRARFEMPPAGDAVPTLPAPHRRLAENRALAAAGVDIPDAGAHLSMDNFTPATEGAADGSPTEAGREG